MYECDRITCANYVSHPGQLCLECQQREDAENECGDDEDDEHDDLRDTEQPCVKCGTREAIINRVCGMCSELHPYMV